MEHKRDGAGDASAPTQAMPRIRRWRTLLALASLGVAVLGLLSVGAAQMRSGGARPDATAARPAVPVAVAQARTKDLSLYVTGLGTVTPLNTVAVRTRVDGQLMKVLYREGQIVRQGALLAEIDRRPFEVQLAQAEGQLARDQALLENARVDLGRFQVLSGEDSIAKQQLDAQAALVRQYEAALKVDQGQIDNARLQLSYAAVTAPISGRVGLRLVDAGNIVHAADANPLVVITQLDPIGVVFPIPEDGIPRIAAKLSAGQTLAVAALDRTDRTELATGHLLTIDNQIDPGTGTLRCKAEFPNKAGALFPNQFVNVRLQVDVKRNATVVPVVALQRSPDGTYVYVVNPDQTASLRRVKVGASEGEDVAIESGVAAGERVVVDGAERLRDGSRVELPAEGSRAGHSSQQ